METAAELISKRVVEAAITDRLADIAAKLTAIHSNHCVVLDEDGRKFVGIIRLGDVARVSDPGKRILGDLISKVPPVGIDAHESAQDVAGLFERHDLGEAVVFSAGGYYLGLATAESVLKWATSTIRFIDGRAANAESQLAKQSNARSAFLSAISHELRTPLNPAMLIASDRAQAKHLPDDIRQDFDAIAKSIAIEAQLIDDLMEIANIRSGRIPLNLKVQSIHQLLSEELTKIDPLLRSKQISVAKKLAAANDQVRVDERRMRQIFSNILGNSVKFTPHGGEISVSTFSTSLEGDLAITIRDTGVGMTAEKIDQIFIPFSLFKEGESLSAQRHGGLGLGMPIARNLIEIQNGSVLAESDGQDRGTTITITLKRENSNPTS